MKASQILDEIKDVLSVNVNDLKAKVEQSKNKIEVPISQTKGSDGKVSSCIKCGKEIQQKSKFCPFCGSSQNSNAADNKNEPTSNVAVKRKKPKWVFILLFVTLASVAGGYTVYTKKIEAEKEAQAQAEKEAQAQAEKEAQAAKDEQMRLESVAREKAHAAQEAAAEAKRIEESKGYEAILSCGMSAGDNINILACFTNTELEINNGGQYDMYKVYNISSLGQQQRDGLHIQLSHHFIIKAQNSQDTLLLNLKIVDSNGAILFQKSASKYGVISVTN